MKIAYLAHLDTHRESGVSKKMASQICMWQALGHTARPFILSSKPTTGPLALNAHQPEIQHRVGLANLHAAASRQRRQVQSWQPDAVYLRYSIHLPAWVQLSKKFPMFLEINSDDRVEAKQNWPWPLRAYHAWTRQRMLRAAHGALFVTRELMNRFNLPAPGCVISNGFDLDACTPVPGPTSDETRLLFMGSPHQAWNGLDKIVWLARQRPRWSFDLVGVSKNDLVDPPSNLHLHGVLEQKAYRPLLTRADLAIGTLSLHAKHMNEACPLKVREYLAHGLPVIVGYQDTDFSNAPAPFLLQLPNHANNVADHLHRIDDFVATWKGRRVDRSALRVLNLREKETERLAFMKRVMHP